jgi:hypothetical protein
MTDYQRLIDNIRAFLASANQMKTPQLVEWSDQYAQACTEANERLRRCLDYLQKGLRTEAIHAAEEQPNLLDLVAMLDLQEIEAWKAICFQYEVTDAPELAMESAAALNEAYVEGESAKSLLTRHRLLALAGAPVRDRLNTMRRLAEIDPAGPFWEEDLRIFERARLEEIRIAVPQVGKSGNLLAAQHLYDELNSNAWRTVVPAELKTRAQEMAARLRGVDAEALLRKLLPALNDAYSAMSVAECQTLLDQWNAAVGESGVAVPAELQEQIDPIVAWVAEQQAAADQQTAFDEACNELQQALDIDAPDATLERKYLTAVRFRLAMPEELESRYQGRLVARASARRNKRLLILAAIIAAFLIVGGVAGAMMFQSMRNREVADVQTALQAGLQDVDGGNADRAAATMKQLLAEHPRIAGNPGVMKAAADLRSAIDAEHKRGADFQRHIAAVLTDGVEHPNLSELGAAEPLAKFDVEHSQVSAVQGQIDDYRGSQQRDRDQKFIAAGKALTDEIDSVLTPELLQSDPARFQAQLAAFEGRAAELGKSSGVSSALVETQVHSASALLKQKQAGMNEAQVEQVLLDEIGASTSSDTQEAALKAYVDKFPQSIRSVDFRQTLEQVKAVHAIEAWELVSKAWVKWDPDNNQEINDRVQKIADYLKATPDSPFAHALGDYVTYLHLAQQTAADDGGWKKTFRDLLNNPLIHDLQMVETQKTGARYYTLGDIKLRAPNLNGKTPSEDFNAVTSSDVSKRAHIALREDDGTGLLKSNTPVPSPQAIFSADALRQIDHMSLANWAQCGPGIIAMLQAHSDMNPVLHAILLQSALQTSQPMLDWAGDSECKPILDGLAKQGLDNLEWLDPDHQPSQTVLDPLQQLIQKCPSMKVIAADIAKRRDEVFGGMPPSLRVQGVALKAGNGLRLTARPDGPSLAYVVGSAGKLLQIARFDGQAWKVDIAMINQVSDGALVFVGAASN